MMPPLPIASGLAALGLELNSARGDQVAAFVALLGKWNRTYNLTAVRDEQGIFRLHILDSLSVWKYVEPGSLLDVGSGGGFPGIPLAIVIPELAVTVMDSNSKKTAFLRQTAIDLGLANLSVHTGRAEQWHPQAPFPQIVSRAFAELADFVRLTRHLLAPGGRWLAMKGVYPREEIERLPAGTEVEAVHRLVVPEVDGERHLVIVRRIEV